MEGPRQLRDAGVFDRKAVSRDRVFLADDARTFGRWGYFGQPSRQDMSNGATLFHSRLFDDSTCDLVADNGTNSIVRSWGSLPWTTGHTIGATRFLELHCLASYFVRFLF